MTYGSLTVLRRAKPHNGASMDWVRCSCGSKKFTVRTSALKSGKVTRCRNSIHRLRDEASTGANSNHKEK